MDERRPRASILLSLRRFARSGLGLVQNRLELFSVELEEQKVRLVKLLALAGAAIFLGNTALLTISAAIVVLVGEKARIAVLFSLGALYTIATVWAVLALRAELKSAPPPFQETVSELKKDTDLLTPPDSNA